MLGSVSFERARLRSSIKTAGGALGFEDVDGPLGFENADSPLGFEGARLQPCRKLPKILRALAPEVLRFFSKSANPRTFPISGPLWPELSL